jgi:hypothetical protein
VTNEEQRAIEKEALAAAGWVTCSPHEWVWRHDQQVAMARYCIAASNRLELYDWMVEMRCILLENADINGPRWVLVDVDDEEIGAGDTPEDAIANARSDVEAEKSKR